jgi:hypothetical protein
MIEFGNDAIASFIKMSPEVVQEFALTQSPPQAGEIDRNGSRHAIPLPLLPLRSAAMLGTIVFLDMGLHCLFSVTLRMNHMAHRSVSMVCRCFMASSFVVLGSFLMMKRRMLQVF